MAQVIQTARLSIREFTIADTAFIIELVNSKGWLQFIGDRNIKTEMQAVDYLESGPIKSYAMNGYGLYLVEKRDDNCPVGMCGIIKRETLIHPDIGFAFLPQYTRQGYAFEAADAALAYAKNKLHLNTILAITVLNNQRSINLLARLGFHFVKNIMLHKELLLLYANEKEVHHVLTPACNMDTAS